MINKERVGEWAAANGIALAPGKLDDLDRYAGEVAETNKQFNLTAITDPEQMEILNIIDCLSVVPFIPEGARVADVGTGAGFPGMVIRIMRDDIDVDREPQRGQEHYSQPDLGVRESDSISGSGYYKGHNRRTGDSRRHHAYARRHSGHQRERLRRSGADRHRQSTEQASEIVSYHGRIRCVKTSNLLSLVQNVILNKLYDPEKLKEELLEKIKQKKKEKNARKKVPVVDKATGEVKEKEVSASEADRIRLQRAREIDKERYGDE